MAKLNEIRVDKDKTEGGVWHDWRLGIRLKVRSAGCVEYRRAVRKAAFKRQRLGEDIEGAADPEQMRKMTAKHLLVDWEHVEDDDGNVLLFDTGKAVALAEDPAYAPLFDDILVMANETEAYREKAIGDAVGN